MTSRHVAVVGGGWAGLAAAVHTIELGGTVTLFEAATHLGGRARRVETRGLVLDNGQHILIGAYRETLALMTRLGVDPARVLHREPLALVYPDGRGLRLPPGPPTLAFARAVARRRGWSWRERWALLKAAAGWRAAGFVCPADWTVARLTQDLPARIVADLVEPLCVAALNTPAERASAAVFLRVLHDALLGGPGSADLLLPRTTLAALLPDAAQRWLTARGATLALGARVQAIERHGAGWRVGGIDCDAVVLACSAAEAARLAAAEAPSWAPRAAALDHEPIVTVYVLSRGTRLPQRMTALQADAERPAQFVFDHGALDMNDGVFAFVASGARAWLAQGREAIAAATLRQAAGAFAPGTWREPPAVLRVIAERRATFACTPGLDRPPMAVAPGLVACGDYIEGLYPATLEGAVRSGLAAAAALSSG